MQLVIEERHATRASRDNLWRVLDELSLWPDWDPYIVSLQRADGVDPGRAQTWVPGPPRAGTSGFVAGHSRRASA